MPAQYRFRHDCRDKGDELLNEVEKAQAPMCSGASA